MNYADFVGQIKGIMSEKVKKEIGEDYRVIHQKVLKNNDCELDALTINNATSNISPTIYLKKFYDDYCDGEDFATITDEMLKMYREHKDNLDFNVEDFKDFDKIKNRIAYKLVNAKSNHLLLSRVPHIKKMDLAIVFYCVMDAEMTGSATALIHNSHMVLWGVEKSDLMTLAAKNTPKIMPPVIKPIEELVKDMMVNEFIYKYGDYDPEDEMMCEELTEYEAMAEDMINEMYDMREEIEMHVLTNKNKYNGAACILYKNLLSKFSEEHEDKNIYIIPSSVHEVILVPDNGNIDRDMINEMIREVNIQEVDEGDVLSNHVYIYNARKKKILMK